MADRLKEIEKKIRGKMLGIRTGKIKKEGSGIGSLFIDLKKIDEPLYDSLMTEYKTILDNIKKQESSKEEKNE